MIKINWLANIRSVGKRAFNQNGPPHGALNTQDINFSIKNILIDFWFCTGNCWKNSKFVHFGLIGRNPNLFEIACIVGQPQIYESAIFSKNRLLFNLDSVQEIVENFLNWSILGADLLFIQNHADPQKHNCPFEQQSQRPKICHTNFTSS